MSFLNDGHSTIISFSEAPNVLFREKEVTPPGAEGGGENDTTTMRNTTWRTKQPKKLKSLTPMSSTVSYDPAVYDTIDAITQVNQEVTVTFPDGSQLTFWGWLDSFTPGAAVEGEQPTADINVIPGNQDNNANEVAPVFTPAP